MNYLVMDTSCGITSIGIFSNNTLLREVYSTTKNKSSDNIISIIDSAMKKSGLVFSQLDFVVVIAGPGFFTGLRVGLTVAKILGLSLNISVVSLNSLEVMTFEMLKTSDPVKPTKQAILSTYDIGKSGACIALFMDNKMVSGITYIEAHTFINFYNTNLKNIARIEVIGNKISFVKTCLGQYTNIKANYNQHIRKVNILHLGELGLQKFKNQDIKTVTAIYV